MHRQNVQTTQKVWSHVPQYVQCVRLSMITTLEENEEYESAWWVRLYLQPVIWMLALAFPLQAKVVGIVFDDLGSIGSQLSNRFIYSAGDARQPASG